MGQRGVTLVEILIVVVMASIIGGLIVSMFVTSNRTFMDQGKVLDVQRSGRVAMDTMTRLLREAGLDPLGSANARITRATATEIQFTRDANINGTIDAAGHETIEFAYDAVANVLRRSFDGAAGIVMADKVTGFALSYFDTDGNDIGIPGSDAAALARIRSLELTIDLVDDKTAGGDFERRYKTGIYCRNL